MLKLKDRFISRAFREFVAKQPCVVCGKGATASHMKSKKFADGSDALCVPACMPVHHVSSTKTSREIIERAGIDLEKLHRKLWNVFLTHAGIIRYVETQEQFEHYCTVYGLRDGSDSKRKNRKEFHSPVNHF